MLRRFRPLPLASIALLLLVGTAVARGAGRSTSAVGCFGSAINLATSSGPFAVVTADFNGDGNLDLAAANSGGSTVSVFLGNGAGGFAPAASFPVGVQPIDIVSADFNADGRPDLAVANSGAPATGADDISVLLGTGTGSFGPAQNFGIGNPTAAFPSSIAVADFNSDGRTDLALGTYGLLRVSILLGNGAGSFSLLGTFGPSSQNLFSIAAGDFNLDGNPDVVATADFIHSVTVFLGTATGALGAPTAFPAGPLAISVEVGDLNGDGRPDLAVADQGGFVSVLLGNGQGGFGPFTPFPVGFSPRGVVLADFDLDGRLDAAVTNSGSNSVSVLLGNGLGELGPATSFAVGAAPIGIAAGDFDRDGLPDLAVANSVSNSVSVLMNAAPTVTPATLPGGTVSATYPTTTFGGSGGVPPLTFVLSGVLPAGLGFDAGDGTLSGVPTQAGTSTFSVTVTDANGCSSTRSYSLTVDRADTAVVLTSASNPAFPGPLRLMAMVSVSPAGPGTPTGSVFFHDALDLIGTAPLVNGVATIEVSLSIGTHLLTAVYSGDSNFEPSTSEVLAQIVAPPDIPTLGPVTLVLLAALLAVVALVMIGRSS